MEVAYKFKEVPDEVCLGCPYSMEDGVSNKYRCIFGEGTYNEELDTPRCTEW